MRKLIKDTLTTKGKYSRKSITILVTFIFIICVGTFIVISDKILDSEVNRYAIAVFDSMLLFEATLMGLTEFGKKFENKNTQE